MINNQVRFKVKGFLVDWAKDRLLPGEKGLGSWWRRVKACICFPFYWTCLGSICWTFIVEGFFFMLLGLAILRLVAYYWNTRVESDADADVDVKYKIHFLCPNEVKIMRLRPDQNEL